MQIDGEGYPSLPMVSHECIYFSHWLQSLDNVTQNYLKASLQFQYKNLCNDYKEKIIMDEAETKYYVVCSLWPLSRVATKQNLGL